MRINQVINACKRGLNACKQGLNAVKTCAKRGQNACKPRSKRGPNAVTPRSKRGIRAVETETRYTLYLIRTIRVHCTAAYTVTGIAETALFSIEYGEPLVSARLPHLLQLRRLTSSYIKLSLSCVHNTDTQVTIHTISTLCTYMYPGGKVRAISRGVLARGDIARDPARSRQIPWFRVRLRAISRAYN